MHPRETSDPPGDSKASQPISASFRPNFYVHPSDLSALPQPSLQEDNDDDAGNDDQCDNTDDDEDNDHNDGNDENTTQSGQQPKPISPREG